MRNVNAPIHFSLPYTFSLREFEKLISMLIPIMAMKIANEAKYTKRPYYPLSRQWDSGRTNNGPKKAQQHCGCLISEVSLAQLPRQPTVCYGLDSDSACHARLQIYVSMRRCRDANESKRGDGEGKPESKRRRRRRQ
ncbi:hypothetical protein VTH06DRAFT_3057 [Thermothelomyces fergusii]